MGQYDRRKIREYLRNEDFEEALDWSEVEAEESKKRAKKESVIIDKANKPQRRDNGKRDFLND